MKRPVRKAQYSHETYANGSPFDATAAVARGQLVHEKLVVVGQVAGSLFDH